MTVTDKLKQLNKIIEKQDKLIKAQEDMIRTLKALLNVQALH